MLVLYHGELGERFLKECKDKIPDDLLNDVAEELRKYYLIKDSDLYYRLINCEYRIRHQREELQTLLNQKINLQIQLKKLRSKPMVQNKMDGE